MSVQRRIEQAVAGGERAAVFTVIEGASIGAKLFVQEGGADVQGDGPQSLAALADGLIGAAKNHVLEHEGQQVFVEIVAPPPRLVVFGAVDTAEKLCGMAKLLGWTTIVADARAKFATPERLPSADQIIVAWPEEAILQIAPDHQTAVVVLTHDDKFDVPAIKGALETDAFYIGALGSRRNQEKRRERLLEAGVPEAQLARISGPCGLDLGADSQPETAISILAEALAVRAGRDGGKLEQARGRIHAGAE
jgi:xanthine dehydrogenase accessory factor